MTNHYTDVCESTVAELRQQLAKALELLEDCSGWLHADHPQERDLLRKIGEFLNAVPEHELPLDDSGITAEVFRPEKLK